MEYNMTKQKEMDALMTYKTVVSNIIADYENGNADFNTCTDHLKSVSELFQFVKLSNEKKDEMD
jgi:hypothetical protein